MKTSGTEFINVNATELGSEGRMPIPRKRRELGQKLDTGHHGRTTRGGTAVRDHSKHGGTRAKSPPSNASMAGIIALVVALCAIGIFAATRLPNSDSGSKRTDAGNGAGAGTNAQPNRQITVTFQNDKISLNGGEISLPTPLSSFTGVLGAPDRISHLSNTIYTWDRLGVMCFGRPDDGQIIQITLAYGQDTPQFWPRAYYQGWANVNGRPAGPAVRPVSISLIPRAFDNKSHYIAFPHYTVSAQTLTLDGPMTSLTFGKTADPDR